MKTLKKIKKAYYLLIGTLLVINTFSNAQEPIDLFILAGQSNAQGYKGDAAYYPADANGLDSQIQLNSTFINYGGNIDGWVPMGPQPGRYDDGHFGLEVSFCRKLKLEGLNPAMFKYTRGATSLYADWKQPGAGGYYDEMVADLIPAIAELENQGHTVNVKGFIWIQGENDASVPEQSEAYEANLTNLISDLRNNVIHDSTMPIILGVDDVNGFDVLTTQQAIAASDPNIIFTSMLGIEKADGTHLTPAGLVVHGERVFDDYKATFINGSSPSSGNLALSGTASQSSTNFNGDASLAIDDNIDGDYNNASVSHTDLETNPWWEVDLGAEYSIGDINVFGRTGRNAARLSDFTVIVYNSNDTEVYAETFTSYPDPSVTSNAGEVIGQRVRIQLNATNYLSLAEVQVMEGDGSSPVVSNFALNGAVSQSSTAYSGAASRAIDDNTNGVWTGGSVTHTSPEANPWWEVDLGSNETIDEIVVWGRTDACCANRLSNYTVSVIQSDGHVSFAQTETSNPDPSTTIDVGGALGSVVRIQLNTTNVALSLAEVQVLGTSSSARISDSALKSELSDDSQNTFLIYPNPSSDIINIKLISSKRAKMEIINHFGQIVHSSYINDGSTSIDISGFNAGFYLIKVTGESTSQIRKIIKN